jgi:hypothetical protein
MSKESNNEIPLKQQEAKLDNTNIEVKNEKLQSEALKELSSPPTEKSRNVPKKEYIFTDSSGDKIRLEATIIKNIHEQTDSKGNSQLIELPEEQGKYFKKDKDSKIIESEFPSKLPE